MYRLRSSCSTNNYHWNIQIDFPEIEAVHIAHSPELSPFQDLADIYDRYLIGYHYGPYLAHLSQQLGVPLRSVLDLACGTGKRSADLLSVVSRVVGIDVSEAMLAVARMNNSSGCSFVAADYRDFALDESFDAIICGNDSLNYVEDKDQLTTTFRRVAYHLRPGGLFAFDVLNERGMMHLSQQYLHLDVDGTRCVMCFSYDPTTGTDLTRVVFEHGVETHRRIPVNETDVKLAASKARLSILRHWYFDEMRLGYVLQKDAYST